jgi:hypothetical protein
LALHLWLIEFLSPVHLNHEWLNLYRDRDL